MKNYSKWPDVPDTLATETGLAKMGLKLAPDQQPVARKTGGYGPYFLYEIADAIPKRKPSAAQLAALEKARRQADLNSRCSRCGDTFETSGYYRRYKREDAGNGAYICFWCKDKEGATTWARKFLAQPENIILDTETTGLDDDDQIVEIAIITVSGETLLNTLVQPSIPIPWEASRIHGIDEAEVAAAPTWAAVDGQVFEIFQAAPALAIYNRDYDLRMIAQSAAAYQVPRETAEIAELWKKTACIMRRYASWYGEWSNYHQSYRWQKLGGGHRALGDCRAALAKIEQMAAPQGWEIREAALKRGLDPRRFMELYEAVKKVSANARADQ